MKLNPTVALTFTLLALMFTAGMVSGTWGFALGREALKGITQPDVRPTNNAGNRKGTPANRDQMLILKEPEILKNVKAHMEGKGANTQKNQTESEDEKDQQSAKPTEAQGRLLSVNRQGLPEQSLQMVSPFLVS